MKLKKIYFVRHGITEGNESGAYQLETIPLSKNGLKQAESVATRFKSIQIDTIVASNMNRASQTAETIGKELKLPVHHSVLFREISRPVFVRGKTKEDPEVAKIMKEVVAKFHDKTWHHSDEENFYDLKAIAEKCLEYITSLEEENILVVTHGFILRMMTAVMALGDALTPEIYKKLDHFFITKNTGITLVEENNGKYFLLTWNDHTHL